MAKKVKAKGPTKVKKKKYKTAAWTRKEGQNPDGGLNEKGRASLRARARTSSGLNRRAVSGRSLTAPGVRGR